MVRLQALVDEPRLPNVIRATARAEQPSALRTLATVGGTIANGADDSLFLAALLAHDSVVELASSTAQRSVPLDQLLADGRRPGELIVALSMQTDRRSAIAHTGRTRTTPRSSVSSVAVRVTVRPPRSGCAASALAR